MLHATRTPVFTGNGKLTLLSIFTVDAKHTTLHPVDERDTTYRQCACMHVDSGNGKLTITHLITAHAIHTHVSPVHVCGAYA